MHRYSRLGRVNRGRGLSLKKDSVLLTGVSLSAAWGLFHFLAPNVSEMHGWYVPYILTPDASLLPIFTTHFFHLNLTHLLANIALCMGLCFFLRGIVNSSQMLAMWCTSAPVATLISFLMEPAALVGASGGLLGIVGAAIGWVRLEEKSSLFRLIIGLLVVACTVALPGDPVAHICGLLFGYGLAKSHFTPRLLLAVGTLASLAVFVGLTC